MKNANGNNEKADNKMKSDNSWNWLTLIKKIGIVLAFLISLVSTILCSWAVAKFVNKTIVAKKHVSEEKQAIIDEYQDIAIQLAQDRIMEKYGLQGNVVACEPAYVPEFLGPGSWYTGYFILKIEAEENVINMHVYPDKSIVYDDYQEEAFCNDLETYFMENIDMPTPYGIDVFISGNTDQYSDGMLEGYYSENQFFDAVPKSNGNNEIPYIHIVIKYVDEKGDLQEIFGYQLRDMFGQYPVYVHISNYQDKTAAKEDDSGKVISFYTYEKQLYELEANETYILH